MRGPVNYHRQIFHFSCNNIDLGTDTSMPTTRNFTNEEMSLNENKENEGKQVNGSEIKEKRDAIEHDAEMTEEKEIHEVEMKAIDLEIQDRHVNKNGPSHKSEKHITNRQETGRKNNNGVDADGDVALVLSDELPLPFTPNQPEVWACIDQHIYNECSTTVTMCLQTTFLTPCKSIYVIIVRHMLVS